MTTIPYFNIEHQIKQISPDLIDWNPTDEEYLLVDTSEVPELIEGFPARGWRKHKWECEEIAKAFMLDVRRWEADDESVSHNRAIGVAYCTKLQGQEMAHTLNIIATTGGLILLDMQTKEFWRAERGQDEIYFVEM